MFAHGTRHQIRTMDANVCKSAAAIGKNTGPVCVQRSKAWGPTAAPTEKLKGESALAYAARVAYTGFLSVVDETSKWTAEPLRNISPARWAQGDSCKDTSSIEYLNRLEALCSSYKAVLTRLATNTSFNIAACIPGYNQLDTDFNSCRRMESTLERNMRLEFVHSKVGVSLGEQDTSTYMDPGLEEIVASFLQVVDYKPREALQKAALTLLEKHKKRMLSTCTSSKKRRQEFTNGFAVARSRITGQPIGTGNYCDAASASSGTTETTAASAVDTDDNERLAFASVTKEEHKLAREHFGHISRDREYKFAITHPMYCSWMSTVIDRCSLAGVRVSLLDDLYRKFADKSVQQLRAREGHVARIEKQKVIGDKAKEDYEYDEGIASERCIKNVAFKIEADRKTKRLREEVRQEKNAARKHLRLGLRELTSEDD
jgi:hypothetical protein